MILSKICQITSLFASLTLFLNFCSSEVKEVSFKDPFKDAFEQLDCSYDIETKDNVGDIFCQNCESDYLFWTNDICLNFFNYNENGEIKKAIFTEKEGEYSIVLDDKELHFQCLYYPQLYSSNFALFHSNYYLTIGTDCFVFNLDGHLQRQFSIIKNDDLHSGFDFYGSGVYCNDDRICLASFYRDLDKTYCLNIDEYDENYHCIKSKLFKNNTLHKPYLRFLSTDYYLDTFSYHEDGDFLLLSDRYIVLDNEKMEFDFASHVNINDIELVFNAEHIDVNDTKIDLNDDRLEELDLMYDDEYSCCVVSHNSLHLILQMHYCFGKSKFIFGSTQIEVNQNFIFLYKNGELTYNMPDFSSFFQALCFHSGHFSFLFDSFGPGIYYKNIDERYKNNYCSLAL